MRLLICEDEEDILNGLAKGLRKLNYYVDTAMDGEEALSLYFEWPCKGTSQIKLLC